MGKQSLFIVRTIRNKQIHCVGKNVEFVPHKKHIPSSLQTQPFNDLWGKCHCLLWEKYGTHRHTVLAECKDCTSQETHYFSSPKANILMLFREKFAVYCENHKEHTDTLCEQNVELYLTGNKLLLRYKSKAVNSVWGNFRCFCSENHTEHREKLCEQNVELYLTGNTLRLHYKAQPVNAVWGNNGSILWEPYGTHRYTVWAEFGACTSHDTFYGSGTKPNQLMPFRERFPLYCENNTEQRDTRCR
jgi:hypothetical protein